MNYRALYKINSLLISIIFLGAIFTSLILGIVDQDSEISRTEKRALASFPPIELRGGSIKRFPGLFDDYYADHFGGREWLSSAYRRIKLALGDSPSQDVTFGKDGWLFLGSIRNGYDNYNNPMGDARNADLYSDEDLQYVTAYMSKLKQWLNGQGIQYMFVLLPNKHTIYPEYLPDYLKKVTPYSSADQLVNYIRNNTDVNVVDVRQRLLESKQGHRLYSVSDTHWNHYAANLAQYEIFQALQTVFPNQIEPQYYELASGVQKFGGDLAGMIGERESYEELAPNPVFKKGCKPVKQPKNAEETDIHTVTCDTAELKVLIFRDSFFNFLKPYFSRQFSRITYVWGVLDYEILKQQLAIEKPDLVIEEIVERKLPYIPDPIRELNLMKQVDNYLNMKQ
ncbi:MAG: hypothetical protein ABW101_01500 [Candidatus Thiodiazotropha sp.]